ncbi:MAG TPA: orotidine-5'-phosphate decarboxylase [Gemmatimonadales bacterium]
MAEVIVAFDLPSATEALNLADRLPDLRWAKLGPVTFLDGGPALVRSFQDRGVQVFLDFKWHDIPSTVAEAVKAADRLGVSLVTVHALGGEAMMGAAVEARHRVRLAAVTVLTSHTAQSFSAALGHSMLDLEAEVERLARVAAGSGADGVVCSAHEISTVRRVMPAGSWIIVPGIRSPGAPADDQRRTSEPGWAAAQGATHLVVGRPVREAKDPAEVYQAICQDVV